MTECLKELTRKFLSQRHQLLAFVHGLVRDWGVAEEILQEVWICLADSVEKDTQIDSVEKWCRGVARNLVLHHWRRCRSSRVVVDSRMLDLVERAFEEQDDAESEWSSRRHWLLDCIAALPVRSRELLHLKYTCGLRVAAIAERLHRSQDAIMKALSRVRQSLAECVERRQALEGGPV